MATRATDTLLATVIEVLASIAPEVRDAPLDPERPLRDQIELDSMDHLHFAVALKERLGVDVPLEEYSNWRCLKDAVSYIEQRRAI